MLCDNIAMSLWSQAWALQLYHIKSMKTSLEGDPRFPLKIAALIMSTVLRSWNRSLELVNPYTIVYINFSFARLSLLKLRSNDNTSSFSCHKRVKRDFAAQGGYEVWLTKALPAPTTQR